MSAEVFPGIAMMATPDGEDEEKKKPAQSMGRFRIERSMKDEVSTSFCRDHERHEYHDDKGIAVGPLILWSSRFRWMARRKGDQGAVSGLSLRGYTGIDARANANTSTAESEASSNTEGGYAVRAAAGWATRRREAMEAAEERVHASREIAPSGIKIVQRVQGSSDSERMV